MTIRTVVADDEPLARERMTRFISADREFDVIKECRNGKEVLGAIDSLSPDLLLLDIQMPGISGLDLAKQIKGRGRPIVVFVTAHDQFAIEAFDLEAIDYLTKPIEPERFQSAMRRAKQRLEMETALLHHERFRSALTALESLRTRSETTARFLVKSGSADLLVKVSDVMWIEAADYYVCLHIGDKQHLLRETIKKLESQLDPKKFIRVHRSAIVNLDFLREMHRDGRSESWIVMANGDRVRMSPAGWQKLLAVAAG